MLRRSLVIAVLAWFGVVAVTSAVAWAAINAAGESVLSQDDGLPPIGGPVVSAGPSTEPPLPSPDDRSHSPSPRSSPPQTRPSAPDRTTASPSPLDPPPETSAPPEPAPPTRPTPRTGGSRGDSEQRTWTGSPGSVTVRCSGPRVSLQSATPNDGFRVEIRERGPEEVEVRFESEEDEVKVFAACAGGVPRFSSDS